MWGTIDSSASRKVDVSGAPLSEVEDLLGGSPTVLVADCEGGLISLLEDYPHIIDDVVAIYYERDPPGDYTASEALLAAKGFVPGAHRVVAPRRRPRERAAAAGDRCCGGLDDGGRDHGGRGRDHGGARRRRGDHARPQGQGRAAVAVAVANAVVLDGRY